MTTAHQGVACQESKRPADCSAGAFPEQLPPPVLTLQYIRGKAAAGAGPRPKPRNCPDLDKVPDSVFKGLNALRPGSFQNYSGSIPASLIIAVQLTSSLLTNVSNSRGPLQ
jgi:hypothetical protein